MFVLTEINAFINNSNIVLNYKEYHIIINFVVNIIVLLY